MYKRREVLGSSLASRNQITLEIIPEHTEY